MSDLKSKTLVELIDFIYSMLSEEITDTAKKNLFNHHVEELAFRLSISKASTIIFAFVFFHSLRGCYMTKREVVAIVFTHPTTNIYLAIQELIKNNLIKSYRNHPRRPEICFYTLDDLDKLIISNKAPVSPTKNTVVKSVISLLPFANGKDNWICLDKSKIGVVYNLTTDFGNYTAVVGDDIVFHDDTIEGIVTKLNQLLQENKLNLK